MKFDFKWYGTWRECFLYNDHVSCKINIVIGSKVKVTLSISVKFFLFQFQGLLISCINCSIFQPEDWKEVELDFMHNCVELPSDASAGIECVEGKPGFVKFQYDSLYSEYFTILPLWNYMRDNKIKSHPQATYISPMYMKDRMTKIVAMIEPVYMQLAGSFFFGRPINVTQVETNNTETTAEQEFDFKEADGSLIEHVSLDQVPSVRLYFWPQQAANWIKRSRQWPPHDDIQRIVDDGCQVVPRSSPGGDSNSEWRLSFSIPEASLAKLRSLDQKRAYYFFKIIFYRHLKCIESSEAEKKSLYSYVMKTTMLWFCEEYPPTDSVWTSLELSVQMLLARLVDNLQDGKIAHYFLPEINLIERVGSDVIAFCIDEVKNLQDNLTMAVPTDLDERLDVVKILRRASEILKRIAPKWLEEECTFWSIFPELLSIIEQLK